MVSDQRWRSMAAIVPAGLSDPLCGSVTLPWGFSSQRGPPYSLSSPSLQASRARSQALPRNRSGKLGGKCAALAEGDFTGVGEGGLFSLGCPAADLGTAHSSITLAPCSRCHQTPSQTPGHHWSLPYRASLLQEVNLRLLPHHL